MMPGKPFSPWPRMQPGQTMRPNTARIKPPGLQVTTPQPSVAPIPQPFQPQVEQMPTAYNVNEITKPVMGGQEIPPDLKMMLKLMGR